MAARYRLNVVLASFPDDAKITIGRQPYSDPSYLGELRERLRGTHLVRRSREGIEIIGYLPDAALVGEAHEIHLRERLDIGQSLLREWLARSLMERELRIRLGRTIEYTSHRPGSNILAECAHGIVLPDGVGCWIAADFDVRKIRGASGHMRLAIVIDVRTRITLDCPLPAFMAVGLDPHGLYLQHEVKTPHGTRRRLAGYVRHIEDGMVILGDHEEGLPAIPLDAAWLEPRKENLERALRAIAGTRATRILNQLKVKRAERVGGPARIELVDKWVNAIGDLPNHLAQGVKVRVAQQVLHADGGRFPPYELYRKPALVFDVGRTKTQVWNQGGLDEFGPYNFERFSPKRLNIAVICQTAKQGEVERFLKQMFDGIPGSRHAARGFVRRFHLEHPFVRIFTCRSPGASHYREAVSAAIDDATSRDQKWHLVLVQTDEAFHELTGDENPYLITKALFLAQGVPTQAFEWESIKPGTWVDATASNMGLASYAKIGGVPWLLPVHQTVSHEVVVGLGSFENSESRFGRRKRYIGVATVFSSDGRYLLESRTPATPAEEYLPALLSVLERVVNEVRRQDAWSNDDPVRFIFHVFKDFNHTEIKAVKSLMARLQLPHAEFAFVHLVEEHPFMLFDLGQLGEGGERGKKKGAMAAPRGLRVDLARNEALVCLKGPKEMRQWTDGEPKPLLLRLHKDSTFRDLSTLARQVFEFSCLSWRTFLPSPLPITVLYSDLVARKLLLLRDVTGWSPEHILGPIGRTRWFL